MKLWSVYRHSVSCLSYCSLSRADNVVEHCRLEGVVVRTFVIVVCVVVVVDVVVAVTPVVSVVTVILEVAIVEEVTVVEVETVLAVEEVVAVLTVLPVAAKEAVAHVHWTKKMDLRKFASRANM